MFDSDWECIWINENGDGDEDEDEDGDECGVW